MKFKVKRGRQYELGVAGICLGVRPRNAAFKVFLPCAPSLRRRVQGNSSNMKPF